MSKTTRPANVHELSEDDALRRVTESEVRAQMACYPPELKGRARKRIERSVRRQADSYCKVTRQILPLFRLNYLGSGYNLVVQTFRFVKCVLEGKHGDGGV